MFPQQARIVCSSSICARNTDRHSGAVTAVENSASNKSPLRSLIGTGISSARDILFSRTHQTNGHQQYRFQACGPSSSNHTSALWHRSSAISQKLQLGAVCPSHPARVLSTFHPSLCRYNQEGDLLFTAAKVRIPCISTAATCTLSNTATPVSCACQQERSALRCSAAAGGRSAFIGCM